MDVIDPEDVVGRPFPLSASTQDACEPPASVRDICALLECELAQFTSESRDSAWAGPMEERLLESLSARSELTEIRTIECRRSLCVAEVSMSAFFIAEPDSRFYIDNKLRFGHSIYGHEVDSNVAPVWVEVVVFIRG